MEFMGEVSLHSRVTNPIRDQEWTKSLTPRNWTLVLEAVRLSPVRQRRESVSEELCYVRPRNCECHVTTPERTLRFVRPDQ